MLGRFAGRSEDVEHLVLTRHTLPLSNERRFDTTVVIFFDSVTRPAASTVSRKGKQFPARVAPLQLMIKMKLDLLPRDVGTIALGRKLGNYLTRSSYLRDQLTYKKYEWFLECQTVEAVVPFQVLY